MWIFGESRQQVKQEWGMGEEWCVTFSSRSSDTLQSLPVGVLQQTLSPHRALLILIKHSDLMSNALRL
jgi:hypothetical protein